MGTTSLPRPGVSVRTPAPRRPATPDTAATKAHARRLRIRALGARVRFRLAADVILATFFVSHLTPLGSATGTLVNVNTTRAEGIAAATTGEAIALTSLTSTVALIVLFGTALLERKVPLGVSPGVICWHVDWWLGRAGGLRTRTALVMVQGAVAVNPARRR